MKNDQVIRAPYFLAEVIVEHEPDGRRVRKRRMVLPDGTTQDFELRSPYEKCEVCGRPYLTFGRPCDHIDRSPGTRLMPDWCDNPAEWRMIQGRYDYTRGNFGYVRNSDGTVRCETLGGKQLP